MSLSTKLILSCEVECTRDGCHCYLKLKVGVPVPESSYYNQPAFLVAPLIQTIHFFSQIARQQLLAELLSVFSFLIVPAQLSEYVGFCNSTKYRTYHRVQPHQCLRQTKKRICFKYRRNGSQACHSNCWEKRQN